MKIRSASEGPVAATRIGSILERTTNRPGIRAAVLQRVHRLRQAVRQTATRVESRAAAVNAMCTTPIQISDPRSRKAVAMDRSSRSVADNNGTI